MVKKNKSSNRINWIIIIIVIILIVVISIIFLYNHKSKCQKGCEDWARYKYPNSDIRNLEGSDSNVEGCCRCTGFEIINNVLHSWGGEICSNK